MKQYFSSYLRNKKALFNKIEKNKKWIEQKMTKHFFNDCEIKLSDIILWLTGWDFDDKSLNKACKHVFGTKQKCVEELLKLKI